MRTLCGERESIRNRETPEGDGNSPSQSCTIFQYVLEIEKPRKGTETLL